MGEFDPVVLDNLRQPGRRSRGWRRRWAQIHALVAEIDGLDAQPPPDP